MARPGICQSCIRRSTNESKEGWSGVLSVNWASSLPRNNCDVCKYEAKVKDRKRKANGKVREWRMLTKMDVGTKTQSKGKACKVMEEAERDKDM